MNNLALGMDGSHWNGLVSPDKPIDFQKAYNKGVRWWYTKGTDSWVNEAHPYIDEHFHSYCKHAFRPECPIKIRGCFHWLQWSIDPKVAANFFLDRAYSAYPFEIPPILDFEEKSVIAKENFSDFAWRAQVWLEEVERQTNRLPWIYTAEWYLNNFPDWKKLEFMNRYPVIVANYSWWANNMAKLPINWPHMKWEDNKLARIWSDWTGWQFKVTNEGKTYGVDSYSLDLDWFHGDLEELQNFVGITDNVEEPEPLTLEEQVADHERRITALEAR